MGQRHQIFLKINNPVKNDRLFTATGEKEKAKKVFGNGKYTIIALHNQWLYGRSAAVNIINMLLYTSQKTMAEYTNPFDANFYEGDTLDEYIQAVMKLLQVQPNVLHPRGVGFERMHFLNEDGYNIRNDFTIGDNNDGITIIDTLTGKYCMMNLFNYDDDEISNSASDLPALKPVSARLYMKAYYPEDVNKLNEYNLRDKTPEQLEFLVLENKLGNKEIDKEIKRQSNGVLTLKEVKEMFPEVYKKKVKKA